MSSPDSAERQQKKPSRFKPGQSGNPKGRPKGLRHKVTVAAQTLLDGESEALTRKCVELALTGDLTALRLCLERILPPRKESTVNISMPVIKTAADIDQAFDEILQSVAGGYLTPSEGSTLAGIVEKRRAAYETCEIEKRISALENNREVVK